MKQKILLISILIISIFFIATFVSAETTKRVLIEYNNVPTIQSRNLNTNSIEEKTYLDSKTVTKEEFEQLKLDPTIKLIQEYEPFYLTMQPNDALYSSQYHYPLVQSEYAWNLTEGNESIIIAIIDSGIQLDHPDLIGKLWNNTDEFPNGGDDDGNGYIDDIHGYDFVDTSNLFNNDTDCNTSKEDCTTRDNDTTDVNGHGTHCAGIAAASTNNAIGIAGACPNCKIMPLRASYEINDGRASLDAEDVIDAINYSINNNATIISMSFGSPSDIPQIKELINYAHSRGYILIASAGNDNTNTPSYPAAYENVTGIGATTSTDLKASYSNYGSWISLVAPGSNLLSTYISSTYIQKSGTSMSAPLVAGIFGIIKSIFPEKNQTEVINALNSTGTPINFITSNINRINTYSAILELDDENPNVTLISPENNTHSINQTQIFTCNCTDNLQLKNITLFLYNKTSLINQTSYNISGTINNLTFIISNLSYTDYNWSCKAYDLSNNSFNSSTYHLTLSNLTIQQDSPENNTYTNINNTNFTCSASSTNNLTNLTFSIFNSTNLLYNKTIFLNELENTSTFNYTLLNETTYTWNCKVYNNLSVNSITQNRTITYDITYPTYSNLSSTNTYNSATITWNTSEPTNYSINNSGTYTNSSSFSETNSVILTGLSELTFYNYSIQFCDQTGQCNQTEVKNYTTSAAPVVDNNDGGSSSSGGGSSSSGGGTSTTPKQGTQQNPIKQEILQKSYTQEYKIGTQTYFTLPNKANHSLKLNKIINTTHINITIQSKPINLILTQNQEIKINLTNNYTYDLKIKVESIKSNNANITITSINEPIYTKEDRFELHEENTKTQNPENQKLNNINTNYLIISTLIVIITIIAIITKVKKTKVKKKKNEKTKKQTTKTKAISKRPKKIPSDPLKFK